MTRNDFPYRLALVVATVYLFGCFGQKNNADDPDKELDEAEAERLGCPGAYVYDWKRNCRYETKKLCDLEFVACQDTDERNAYDVDGTCWRFNTCIPDANYWPADESDVCHHSRSKITFCEEAEVTCEAVDTLEQCQQAPQCRPALGYEWDTEKLCALEGFEPRYLGCVRDVEECDELTLKRLGDGCILTTTCADPDCPGGDCGGCEEPESFTGCSEWSAQLDIVTFDPDGLDLPQHIEPAAQEGERPDPCVPAVMGEAKWRSGTMFYDEPSLERSVWELMIPVRNQTESATCGFEGAPLRMAVTDLSERSIEQTIYWPEGVACDGTTWLRVKLQHAPNVKQYDVRVSAVDSCGSGGGTITERAERP